MKVFWSWQADTPGKIGRHFVRDALAEAIKALKEPEDVEEPSERDTREALHLDHDRQGVSGSPALAPTIFGKIERSAVFVADVTLVAEIAESNKKLINSNVAIEYGYASHALSDESILMVQNTFYGERDDLPFDLKYKVGPIQYRLEPNATKHEIDAGRNRLRGILVNALRPYLNRVSLRQSVPPKFAEVVSTTNPAFYWAPGEILAQLEDHGSSIFRRSDNVIYEYRFDEPRAFYLRLIPTSPKSELLRLTALTTLADRRRVDVLTRAAYQTSSARNSHGAIVYEAHGESRVPNAITQLFRNGEIWGVTRDLFAEFQGDTVIPDVSVANFYSRVLENYIMIIRELGFDPPYTVEMGAVGLAGARLSMPPPNPMNQVSGPIHQNQLPIRRVLNDTAPASRDAIVSEFRRSLYDLAGLAV